jgi:hypothetical protein
MAHQDLGFSMALFFTGDGTFTIWTGLIPLFPLGNMGGYVWVLG